MKHETAMGPFQQLISSLREQLTANISRSDILRPLAWLIGLLITGILVAEGEHASTLITITLVTMLIASVMIYGFGYIYCLFKDRDALRSERYSLQKMALEHGIYGDSAIGIIEQQPRAQTPLLATAPTTAESERNE
jgi:hypothetical protein